MPRAACPRCRSVVAFEEGETPTCPECGYPGPDARPKAPEPEDLESPPETPAPQEADEPEEAPETRRSGKAVASLVLGIACYPLVFLGTPVALAAILLGFLARNDVAKKPGLRGARMAAWGIGLGIGFIVLGLLFSTLVFFLAEPSGNQTAPAAMGLL